MRRMVETLMRQHGMEITIQHSGDGSAVTVRGFFQPVQSRSWQNANDVATPLGHSPGGQYVFIGPAGTEAAVGDSLSVGDRCFRLRRVEPYYYDGGQIYLWGLCAEKGVNDTWGVQS